jgi:CDP-diglyceride synthetase
MIVSKPMIVFHVSQVFFNFIAMACFASVASFQAKWEVGPCTSQPRFAPRILRSPCGPPVAGLSGFAVFVSVASIILSLFMLLVPVVYEKYDKLARLARALKEVRVGFILNGSGTVLNLLIAYVSPPSPISSAF